MTNLEIAKQLEILADLLEFTGANSFRTRAYRSGARSIRQLTQSLEKMLDEGADLTQLDGIGKGVAEKCVELVQTGKLAQMEEIFESVPPTVLDLLNVPKLGPKKAAALYHELGVSNLEQLRLACEEQRVRELAGFGEKSEQSILAGIAIAVQANARILWAEADEIVRSLKSHFADCQAVQRIDFAGSYRRGRETVGDLDIVVVAQEPEAVMDCLGRFPGVAEVIGRGPTKMSVRLASGLAIDLRVIPAESFGAALQYFTGSKEHNVSVRRWAKEQGLKVNEWGVFRETDPEVSIAGAEEDEVYQSLGMHWVPPELRENRGEVEQARREEFPPMIEVSDLMGDLHMHTTATDGAASVEEMADAARKIGLKYIAITDHSKRVTMARGLDEHRLLLQWEEIDRINQNAQDDFLILKGIECDILEGGGMDLPDEVLAQADWVIASVHYGQNQPRDQITSRIVDALYNPFVSMLAHPTGRLINRREPYDVDMETVMQVAQKNRKMLELNASPRRLDLNENLLIAAKELRIPIVINTDAHHPDGLGAMRFGVMQARRAGLLPGDVANTRPWAELKKYFQHG